MAITLKQVRDDIRSRVNDEKGELTNSALNQWVNIAQNVVFNQLFPIISTKLTGTNLQTTTADVAIYSIPADCRQIRRVKVGTTAITLKKAREKSIDEIDSVDRTFDLATVEEPAFLEWANNIEIYPTPTATIANALRIDYIKQVTVLAADTDVSAIPEEYHGLITDYVEAYVLRKLGRADKATIADQTISKMFGDIIAANSQQMAMTESGMDKKI